MLTATIDEFELDIRLQDVRADELRGEKYPQPTMPIVCHTSTFCADF
ncbi:hypothetical protein [Kribbella sp. NPDC006257]